MESGKSCTRISVHTAYILYCLYDDVQCTIRIVRTLDVVRRLAYRLCSPCVLFLYCVLSVYSLLMICVRSVYGLCTVSVLCMYVYGLCTVCVLCVRSVYYVCTV